MASCEERLSTVQFRHKLAAALVATWACLITVLPARADNYVGLINLDAKATVNTKTYYFDRLNREMRMAAIVRNISSEPIRTPLVLAFRGLPAGVMLVSSGTLPDGTPYVDLSNVMASGVLSPGASTGSLQVAFVNPNLARFTPTMSVWGTPYLSATAVANPASGYAPLAVSFSATTVGGVARYEWDFTDDGTYDFSSTSSPNTSYTYGDVGTFTARLRVTSTDGSTTVTDTVVISTSKGIEVRVPEKMTTSFPEIMTTFEVMVSGSFASRRPGAMGLSAARKKEDDQHVGPGTHLDASAGWTHAGRGRRGGGGWQEFGTANPEGAADHQPGDGAHAEVTADRAAEPG